MTSVMQLNTRIESFPTNLIANNFGFKQAEYFPGCARRPGGAEGRSLDGRRRRAAAAPPPRT